MFSGRWIKSPVSVSLLRKIRIRQSIFGALRLPISVAIFLFKLTRFQTETLNYFEESQKHLCLLKIPKDVKMRVTRSVYGWMFDPSHSRALNLFFYFILFVLFILLYPLSVGMVPLLV